MAKNPRKPPCHAWKRPFHLRAKGKKKRQEGYVEIFESVDGWAGEIVIGAKKFGYARAGLSLNVIKGPTGITSAVERSKYIPGLPIWGDWRCVDPGGLRGLSDLRPRYCRRTVKGRSKCYDITWGDFQGFATPLQNCRGETRKCPRGMRTTL